MGKIDSDSADRLRGKLDQNHSPVRVIPGGELFDDDTGGKLWSCGFDLKASDRHLDGKTLAGNRLEPPLFKPVFKNRRSAGWSI